MSVFRVMSGIGIFFLFVGLILFHLMKSSGDKEFRRYLDTRVEVPIEEQPSTRYYKACKLILRISTGFLAVGLFGTLLVG